MKGNTKELGSFGERKAVHYYRKKGYRIVASNYTCSYGEIDLIVERSGVLVFVEVKTRQSDRFGTPAEAVNLRKQQKIRTVAEYFLQQEPRECDIRFDVIEVLAEPSLFGGFRVGELRQIEQAF